MNLRILAALTAALSAAPFTQAWAAPQVLDLIANRGLEWQHDRASRDLNIEYWQSVVGS